MLKLGRVSNGNIIDEHCTVTGELICNQNKVYTCTLNQTDICNGKNTNKFYIIQLINDGKNYVLYTRYGRIGEKGRTGTKIFYKINIGILEFEKIFKSKTGNDFMCGPFIKIPGKYNLAQIKVENLDNTMTGSKDQIPNSSLDPAVKDLITMLSDIKMINSLMIALDIDTQKLPLGNLDKDQIQKASSVLDRIDEVLKLWETNIYNTNFISQQNKSILDLKQQKSIEDLEQQISMVDTKHNTSTLPTFKIKVGPSHDKSKPIPKNFPKPRLPKSYKPATVKKDIEINDKSNVISLTPHSNELPTPDSKEISAEIPILKSQLNLNDKIAELSSTFYTYIPYSSGRRAPPLIDNNDVVSKYRNMLDELAQTVVTAKIIKDGNSNGNENPVDLIYNGLGKTIVPLDSNSKIYYELVKYISNTHGPTHRSKLKVQSIFEIQNKQLKNCTLKNKILLFHGTPQSCVLSIFKNDFYLDPGKMGISVTGKMFGYGVYFADVITKSFNYTHADSTGGIGCILVCEIALGDTYETLHSDSSLNKYNLSKKGYQSTSAKGRYAPSSSVTVDDMVIPNGKIEDKNVKGSLIYNEYIVYDIDQINIKYLVVVKD